MSPQPSQEVSNYWLPRKKGTSSLHLLETIIKYNPLGLFRISRRDHIVEVRQANVV